jgi:hypothetical protein
MTLLQSGLAKSLGPPAYSIDNSCMFYGGTMARTPSVQGSLQKLTLSLWLKVVPLSVTNRQIWYTTIGGNGEGGFYFPTPNTIQWFWYDYGSGGSYKFNLQSTQVFRDPSTWYHFVASLDTTQAVEANRVKIYVNGEQITDFSAEVYPSINYNTSFNTTNSHVIGSTNWGGYIADFYYLDGTQLTPSSFGELNTTTNQWVPLDSDDVKDAVTFGTNGFYLDFADGADLGDDESGEGNDWAETNLDATNQMLDSPTNNFCTLNPLNGKSGLVDELVEGNLRLGDGSSESGYNLFSTFGVSSGKWYYEYRDTSPATRNSGIGWCDVNMTPTGTGDGALTVVGAIWYNTVMYQQGSSGAIGATLDTDVIAGVALDADAGKVWFSHDGTWWDSQDPAAGSNPKFTAGTNPSTWTPILQNGNLGSGTVNYGQDSSFAGEVTAQGNQDGNGKGDFYYTPPTDYLALCTDNLSAPEIALPGEHFETKLYTGNGTVIGSGGNTISGLSFQPDYTWIKERTQIRNHNAFDSVRGVTKFLAPDESDAEVTNTESLTSWTSDGFTLGDRVSVNEDTENFVSWNWKAGGAPTVDNSAGAGATPTAGSVKIDGSNLGSALGGTVAATKLSANTTSGFSIVQWTGTETSISLAHGLSEPPELVIVKCAGAVGSWRIGQSVITGQKFDTDDGWYLEFTTAANHEETSPIIWGDPATTPSASLFYVGSNGSMNTSGQPMVAYCFHSVEGYSKVGTYVGNGVDGDGNFIYCGFKPAWIIFKKTSGTSGWSMYDDKRNTYNPVKNRLYANGSDAATYAYNDIDMVSNGIKLLTNDGAFNDSGATYMFIAFAESPFKYSNAR